GPAAKSGLLHAIRISFPVTLNLRKRPSQTLAARGRYLDYPSRSASDVSLYLPEKSQVLRSIRNASKKVWRRLDDIITCAAGPSDAVAMRKPEQLRETAKIFLPQRAQSRTERKVDARCKCRTHSGDSEGDAKVGGVAARPFRPRGRA